MLHPAQLRTVCLMSLSHAYRTDTVLNLPLCLVTGETPAWSDMFLACSYRVGTSFRLGPNIAAISGLRRLPAPGREETTSASGFVQEFLYIALVRLSGGVEDAQLVDDGFDLALSGGDRDRIRLRRQPRQLPERDVGLRGRGVFGGEFQENGRIQSEDAEEGGMPLLEAVEKPVAQTRRIGDDASEILAEPREEPVVVGAEAKGSVQVPVRP